MTLADMTPYVQDNTFVLPIRVYYEDTDAGGVVYYANYLKFAERARTEMMRHLGVESSDLQEKEGIAFVVRKIEAEYHQPAHLDDLLHVELKLTKLGGASMEGVQRILRGSDVLVTIYIKLGCMKLTGGPGRLPQNIRNLLQTFTSPE